MNNFVEGKLSETGESQRLECICGKKLRIPPNASAKARAGKCPICRAPFEFRDGEWVCITVKSPSLTALEPEQVRSVESLSAKSPPQAGECLEASQAIPQIPSKTAEPVAHDASRLFHSVSAKLSTSAGLTDVTKHHSAGEESVATVEEVNPNDQASERIFAAPSFLEKTTALEYPSVPEDTFLKSAISSEIAEHGHPVTFGDAPPHIEDVPHVPLGFASNREDSMEPVDTEASLTERVEQEQASLNPSELESLAVPSTAEPNCESHPSALVSWLGSTEPHESEPVSHTVSDSFVPELANGNYTNVARTPVDTRGVESRAAADHVQTEKSQSRIGKSSLVDENPADTQAGINQKIRASLASSLGLDARYPENVVAAIALACHPWPDCDISQNDIDSIATELCPGFNINHPSVLEIAVDRLLRFEDALQFQGSKELAASYATAALILESYNGHNAGECRDDGISNKSFGLITSPIGLRNSNSKTIFTQVNDLAKNEESDWNSTVISLLGAAVFRGSRDTGLALGSEATGVSVSCLAEQLAVELPEKQFDDYLDKLDNRALDILASRTFKLGLPDTLVDLASRWKITRERIRQVEAKASEAIRERFTEMFKRLGKQSITPLSSHIFRTEVLYAIATRIAGYSRHREILSGFLADIFGPWQREGHWIYHSSLQDRVDQLRDSLAKQGDAYGVIASNSIETECEGLFFSEEDRDQFLKDEFGFGKYFGTWTNKNTMRCQLAAALRKIGRPATKEELAELLEYPPQSVGSILGNVEGIVRADRYRWGFNEWIDDAYDGIFGEIEQRINEYNGAVPIHVLISEIPSQFDVAENSVRAYLASSAFVVNNGMVRMANNDEYIPRSPSRCADAIRIGDRWGYRSLIYDRHFSGYSMGVNFDVAFANGLRPGDDLIVPVDGCKEEVSLIWRAHNLNRLVDVGRVANYLLAKGYNAGETLILIPSREKIEIIHERELQQRGLELTNQMGLVSSVEGKHSDDKANIGEVRDPLLDLLGGDQ